DGIKTALDAGHGGFPAGTRKKLEAARGYLDVAPSVVITATGVPLPDVDGTLPARPPDAELLTEIGDALRLGSSLSRFRAAVTEAAVTERGSPSAPTALSPPPTACTRWPKRSAPPGWARCC